ncbi:MAG: YhfC family glutamic-type intramembrane protease, partial [Nitrososphaerota archaeon]|nr:YhfC family glutamic-type intramembrane protease [Nitrososphaerota archaeon]
EAMKLILSQGFMVGISLWLIAGLVRSGFKYIFIRNKSYTGALNIGLGFGLTEAFHIGVSGLIASVAAGLTIPIYMISALERFSATMFHTGSTIFMVDMVKKKGILGLILIIVIHGTIDTLIYQFTQSNINYHRIHSFDYRINLNIEVI